MPDDDYDDLGFSMEPHREGLNAMLRLGLSPVSIRPALRARELVVTVNPKMRFQVVVGATGTTIHQASDNAEARQVRDDVERYFARHFPGRTSRLTEADMERSVGNTVSLVNME